jgi:hypothetical protein
LSPSSFALVGALLAAPAFDLDPPDEHQTAAKAFGGANAVKQALLHKNIRLGNRQNAVEIQCAKGNGFAPLPFEQPMLPVAINPDSLG